MVVRFLFFFGAGGRIITLAFGKGREMDWGGEGRGLGGLIFYFMFLVPCLVAIHPRTKGFQEDEGGSRSMRWDASNTALLVFAAAAARVYVLCRLVVWCGVGACGGLLLPPAYLPATCNEINARGAQPSRS